MTDIVERLRSHLDVFRSYPKQTGADDMAGVVQSIEMAADEIERLQEMAKLCRQAALAVDSDPATRFDAIVQFTKDGP